MDSSIINERQKKLGELKVLLNSIDEKLFSLTEELKWDYKKLLEEASNMVTCSINQQHRVPISKVKIHEEKCLWRYQGYSDNEKSFPEHSKIGSFVTLTKESLHAVTKNVSSTTVHLYAVFLFVMMEFKSNHILLPTSTRSFMFARLCQNSSEAENKCLREVPQSSANYDQNFSREEKLAIYDYVIANTQTQISHTELWHEPTEKIKEKKELSAWEIAAAERDAKRRRASYRNKVHTNRKTHTEILREVIEAQMDALKEEVLKKEKTERHEAKRKTSSPERTESSERNRHHISSSRHRKEHKNKRRSHDKHFKHREHKRSPSYSMSDTKSRSRSHDKYRKWKSYEGRSHSHRSSHTHRG